MKTVMKKLLSLALVAILLVSAVPFRADATETNVYKIPVTVYINNVNQSNYNKTLTVKEGETLYLTEALALSLLKNTDGRSLDHWASSNKENIPAGQDLPYAWLMENYPDGGYALSLYLNEEVKPAEHTHDYKLVKTDAATCAKEGTEYYECCCGDTTTKTIPATDDHSYGDWTKGDNNKETRTCGVCGNVETRDAAKEDTYTITFIAGDQTFTRSWKLYQKVSDLPTIPLLDGHERLGWFADEAGTKGQISNGDTWDGQYTTYYACYTEGPNDGLSTLSVYARFYVGGVQQGNTTWLFDQQFEDGASMLKWLNNNEETTSSKIFALKSASEYEWAPRYYYEYSGNEPLAEQDLIADGNKSIVVKVYAKKATQANVLLYVHQYNSTSKKYETKSIHEMAGYTAGNTVTKAEADAVVKKNYSGKNMTITGLYSDTAWEQLLDGQNPTAANGIKVADNGTMKVHVILKNGTASTSTSTADKTNPKTGDMIMFPVMVMLASAAAVAFVYMNSKKRAAR